jgi:alpha-tubulin suppressor-like RCC1 family protein
LSVPGLQDISSFQEMIGQDFDILDISGAIEHTLILKKNGKTFSVGKNDVFNFFLFILERTIGRWNYKR